MKFAILPNLDKAGALQCTIKVSELLHSNNAEVLLSYKIKKLACLDYAGYYKDIEGMVEACDIVITIGGDGTIIRVAKHASKFNKPILGINLGKVGFVASIEQNDIESLKFILSGNYRIENRMMLSVKVKHGSEEIESQALNDVYISSSLLTKIIDLDVCFNNKKICRYRADGIIIATPTGSTAYSLSAGGPVVEPQMKCMLLTPVCDHSLTSRPIVFGEGAVISVQPSISHKEEAALTIDGQKLTLLHNGDKVNICASDTKVKIIKINDKDFYQILNEKLGVRR